MPFRDRSPFSYIVTKNKIITSAASDFMITRAPWPSPVNKLYRLRKAVVSTSGAVGGATVILWDQDLSSATPATRGSAGAALVTISTAANLSGTSSTTYDENSLPREFFQAGITARTTSINTAVSLELEVL